MYTFTSVCTYVCIHIYTQTFIHLSTHITELCSHVRSFSFPLSFSPQCLCVSPSYSFSRVFTRGVRTVPHTFQHINPATHTSPHRTTHFSTHKPCNTHFTTPYHTLLYAMHKFARNSAVSLRSERNPGVRTVTHDCNTLQHAHTLLLFFFYFLLLSLSRSHSLTCKHTHTHTRTNTRTHTQMHTHTHT